uniref:AMP-dependent synthetase and ligase domain containing protein n=1 Tax=Haemonchus contortus TaxID=6289 RepID=A0A7I4YF36_HAECO
MWEEPLFTTNSSRKTEIANTGRGAQSLMSLFGVTTTDRTDVVVVHAADLGWLADWLAGWQVCGVCVRFPVVDSALAVHRALSP